MADIALNWTLNYGGDWLAISDGLALDEGLLTAVIISLFSDRRAAADDLLPGDDDDRRGWWGDAYSEIPGDLIGSRLWLLSRSKLTPALLPLAEEYANESLAWLCSDQVVGKIDLNASIAAPQALGLIVTLTRPDLTLVQYRFKAFWEGR